LGGALAIKAHHTARRYDPKAWNGFAVNGFGELLYRMRGAAYPVARNVHNAQFVASPVAS